MNHHEDTIYRLALKLISGLGDHRFKTIVSVIGDAKSFFQLSSKELLSVPGVTSAIREQILSQSTLSRAEEELKFCEKYKIDILHFDAPDYPNRLKECDNAPAFLFKKGELDLNRRKVIGIVGSRRHSPYGESMVRQLVEGLKAHDAIIVSGLALGIDSIAHRSAMENNLPTIGVLGHGLDRIYPAEHRPLAEQMLRSGALLSELFTDTTPESGNFPMRNRIVAGMVDGLVVAESQIQGGSMITARLALDYHREVMTFPGRVEDPFSRGCNWLIKSQNASCIEGINDLEYVMNWRVSPNQLELNIVLNEKEEKLLKDFTESIMSANQLHRKSNEAVHSINALLLGLELKGILRSLPGQRYERLIW